MPMVVSEEGRLLILEDPSDEELSRVKDHDGPRNHSPQEAG